MQSEPGQPPGNSALRGGAHWASGLGSEMWGPRWERSPERVGSWLLVSLSKPAGNNTCIVPDEMLSVGAMVSFRWYVPY